MNLCKVWWYPLWFLNIDDFHIHKSQDDDKIVGYLLSKPVRSTKQRKKEKELEKQ